MIILENIRYHVKKLEINGKIRPITLYSKKDLIKQKDLYSRYAQLFMEHTHQSVYSFVHGFSNFDAAAAACQFAERYIYYIKIDINKYYPSIQRPLLINALRGLLPEKDAKRICRYVFCCPSGISEGSPLSPAMSNIYLYDFDEAMTDLPVTFYLRFCDDILFLSNIKPKQLYPYIEDALSNYGLTVSIDKLTIGFVSEGFHYLGYVIHGSGLSVQPEKVSEIIDKLHAEPNPKKRGQIANGFKAYYRNPLLLPICRASIEYLNEFGDDEEILVFNKYLDSARDDPFDNDSN